MQAKPLLAIVLAATLSGCAHQSPPLPVAALDECRGIESQRFVFHSDPWVNLHHFLTEWARNLPQPQPGDTRRVVEIREAADLTRLTDAERQSWQTTVDFYRQRFSRRNLTFEPEMVALRVHLSALSCPGGTMSAIDSELAAVLTAAMPVYRRQWWPQHNAANGAWIAALQAQLRSREQALSTRLAEAYAAQWPAEKVRVDAAPYTNWAGGYTTNHPNLVVISSTHYLGLEALEIVFHEVSHATFFEQPLFRDAAAAFQPAKVPERFVHSIQFATPAELLRSMLTDAERPGFRTIAERVYETGRFAKQYAVVLKHWKPFLDGQITRSEALARIAAELVE